MIKEVFSTDFSVSHQISSNWTMKDFHFHDSYEIYYAMSDNVKYFVEDRVYEVKKGMLFVFNSSEIHRTLVPDNIDYERYILLLKPEYIQDIPSIDSDLLEVFFNRTSDFYHGIMLSVEQQEKIVSLFERARYYIDNSVYGAETYKKLVLAEILLFINEIYRTAQKEYYSKIKKGYEKILPIINYIRMNIHDDLSLKAISDRFYISIYHLGHLFKKGTGFSVNQYVINCRILKACELLKKNHNVTDVSEMIGYYDLSHFIRTFKKLVGVSPKQYAIKNRLDH